MTIPDDIENCQIQGLHDRLSISFQNRRIADARLQNLRDDCVFFVLLFFLYSDSVTGKWDVDGEVKGKENSNNNSTIQQKHPVALPRTMSGLRQR